MHPARRRFLTLAYLLLIYSTLGIVRPVAEQLRSAGMLRLTVLILFAVAIPAAIAWRHKEAGRKGMVVRIGLLVLLTSIGLFLPGLPEERIHFLTYGLLGWLICWSLETSASGPWKFRLTAFVLVWLAGGVDELIQLWLPGRVFDLRDIVFNGAAGMLGIAFFTTGENKKTKVD